MPQVIGLALAASIFPPALAAVIALARGEEPRPRVLLFTIGALFVTYVVGVILLDLIAKAGFTGRSNKTPHAWLQIALGLAALAWAFYLWRTPPKPKSESDGDSRTQRYMQSRRLAFALGIVLYVAPSPIYIAAVQAIDDVTKSTSGRLAILALTVVIMLWLIEVPLMLMFARPERSAEIMVSIQDWLARNGRRLGELVLVAFGLYLLVAGIVDVTS
jgi:hypothetical protein